MQNIALCLLCIDVTIVPFVVCTAACDVRSTLDVRERYVVGESLGAIRQILLHCCFVSQPWSYRYTPHPFACLVYFKHTTYTLASSCRSVAVKKLPGIAAPSVSLTEVCLLSVAGAEVAGFTTLFDAAPSLSRPRREPTRTRPSRELAAP